MAPKRCLFDLDLDLCLVGQVHPNNSVIEDVGDINPTVAINTARHGPAEGNTPISYLLSMQLEDGSFEWQPDTGADQSSTQQVIPALLGRWFPLVRTELASCEPQSLPASGGTKEGGLPATERLLWVSTPDGLSIAR